MSAMPRFVLIAAMSMLALVSLAAQAGVYPAGVTGEIQAAIDRGQAWLASNQGADGSWRHAGGLGTYPVAMTGLGGMALLAGGSTPTRGKHYHAVRTAVAFLQKNVDPQTGLIAVPRDEHHSMFGHGFATLFLASVFGMEEDGRQQAQLKSGLDRAIRLIQSSQSSAGGWLYTPDANDDEGSVTVTQVQALRACRMAGLLVSKTTIDRAVTYLRRCQGPDGGIRYKLNGSPESRPAITAAGVSVLYNAGLYEEEAFVEKAVQFCKKHLQVASDTTGHHFYAQHYWSQALWHRGGGDWSDHYARLSHWLLQTQKTDGSWDGDGVGPVYGTALALTMLQLPFAYVPIYQR